LTKRALLWAGTLTGNSECGSSKLEPKFKDLSYGIGLRKSAQQQLQRKMGGLHQQAKENVARPMFDVAKLASRISSLESGYRILRYELTSKDSAQQHQGRAFLEILREKQRQVDYLERGNKFRVRSVASSDQNEGFRLELIWSSNLILRRLFG